MAVAAAILLAVYFCGLLYAIFVPPKQRDPQYGMAIGCAWMVEIGIVAVAILLATAVGFKIDWLVKGVFAVTAFPAVLLIPFVLKTAATEIKRRYFARQTWVRPDQIAATVSGKTHAIGTRVGEPVQPYRDHWHYAPDGRLLLYREESGAITRAPGEGTWSVDDRYLVLTIPPEPPKRYVLFRDRAGQVGYFNQAPGTATDRQLAFRTVAVNDGPPAESPAADRATTDSAG
jgi:hypothetical protein